MVCFLQDGEYRLSAGWRAIIDKIVLQIGQAIRVALGDGMHTKIHSQDMDSTRSERCHHVWWTIYILDRQISSLMGVPMGIPEEQIEAGLPTFPGQPQKSMGLEVQIKLSKVLAQVLHSLVDPSITIWIPILLTLNTCSCIWRRGTSRQVLSCNYEGCVEERC